MPQETQQANDDKIIYTNFTLMKEEASSKSAFLIITLSLLVNDDGTPKNPNYAPCVKAAKKIRNQRIVGRAESIPTLSEKGQMQLAGQEEK